MRFFGFKSKITLILVGIFVLHKMVNQTIKNNKYANSFARSCCEYRINENKTISEILNCDYAGYFCRKLFKALVGNNTKLKDMLLKCTWKGRVATCPASIMNERLISDIKKSYLLSNNNNK